MGAGMLSHISFGVEDLGRAGLFYDAALGTLGFARVWATDEALGYGEPGGPDRLALFHRPGAARAPGAGFHLAFRAVTQTMVDRFHAAALAHGGSDKGAPGLRPHYGPTYYAAFVADPDGYRLEAVCQSTQ